MNIYYKKHKNRILIVYKIVIELDRYIGKTKPNSNFGFTVKKQKNVNYVIISRIVLYFKITL